MESSPTAWRALSGNPLRFLASTRPWRSLLYVATTPVVAAPTAAALGAGLLLGVALSPVAVGIVVLAHLPLLGVPLGAVERRRLRLLGPAAAVADPHASGVPRSPRAWVSVRRDEPATLREICYAVVLVGLGVLNATALLVTLGGTGLFIVSPALAASGDVSLGAWTVRSPGQAVPFALVGGLGGLVVSAYLLSALAAAEAGLARLLLGAREDELHRQLAGLRRSRLDLVDAFETERQRIERHLHDGVQQRLVALTMTLGLGELALPADDAGLRVLRQAREEAEGALSDLREAVRGIHPRVLVDHGVAAAVQEVADRCPLPVGVDLPGDRLPPIVEATAYFVVAEALTNAVKHAQARRCDVRGRVAGRTLVVTVADDGRGGADPASGTGLAGIITRLDALGGTLTVASPDGGPTEVTMECPCHERR